VFRRGVLKDRVLNRIHSIIEMLNGGEGLVDGQLEETEQQGIGAIPEAIPGIALDIEPVLIENGQGSRMVGDEIIRTQEDVQLLEFEHIRLRLDLGDVENDVKIVAPI